MLVKENDPYNEKAKFETAKGQVTSSLANLLPSGDSLISSSEQTPQKVTGGD